MFFKKGSKGDVTPSPSDMEMAVSVPNSAPRSETDSSETNTNQNRATVYGMQFEDGFRYQTVCHRSSSIENDWV
jgi:hypothetical protein